MSSTKEAELNELMCAKTSINDYENLCWLDVLGVADTVFDDTAVY